MGHCNERLYNIFGYLHLSYVDFENIGVMNLTKKIQIGKKINRS